MFRATEAQRSPGALGDDKERVAGEQHTQGGVEVGLE